MSAVLGGSAFGKTTFASGTITPIIRPAAKPNVFGGVPLGTVVFAEPGVPGAKGGGVSTGYAFSTFNKPHGVGGGVSTGSAVATVVTARPVASGGVSAGSAAMRAYLLSSFNADANLLMMQSSDGVNFSYVDGVSGEIVSPVSERILDPSIIYYRGRYWLVYASEFGPNFTLLTSTDLANWDFVCHIIGTSTTYLWAPEWFVDDDGSVHIYFSAGNTIEGDFQIYEIHPVPVGGVIDFSVWSSPVHITGTGTCVIDPCVVKKGGVYYLWYKNELVGHKVIEYGSLSSPTGAYTSIKTGDWAGWGVDREGAMLFPLPDGSGWRIVLDYYNPVHGLHYSDSVDNWATWSTLQPLVAPVIIWHGDVRPFTELVYSPGSSGGGGVAASASGAGISAGSATGGTVTGASATGRGISAGSAHALFEFLGSATGRGISAGSAAAHVIAFGSATGRGISTGTAHGTVTGYVDALLTVAMRPAVAVTATISPTNMVDLTVRPAASAAIYVLRGGADVTTTVLVSATEDIVQGCDALLVADFKNDLGAYVDPGTVTFAVKPNGQTESDYVYGVNLEVTKAFTGRYVLTYPVSYGVTHDFYITGTTPAKAAGAGYFTVKAKPF